MYCFYKLCFAVLGFKIFFFYDGCIVDQSVPRVSSWLSTPDSSLLLVWSLGDHPEGCREAVSAALWGPGWNPWLLALTH